jgi:prepilin-type N-terminal cleavage/methylation domain-containing protein
MDDGEPMVKTRAGMTLLESLVSMAIVSVITLAMYEALSRQGKLASEELAEVDVQRNLRLATDDLVFELADARFTSISDDGRTITYCKPRSDGGMPVIGADGIVSFGVIMNGAFQVDDPNNLFTPRTARYTMTFVDEPAGPTSTVSEATLNLDLNKDGDKIDNFRYGRFTVTANVIDLKTNANLGSQEIAYPPRRVLREFPNGGIFFLRQVNGTGIHRSEPLVDNNNNKAFDKGIDTFTDLNGNGVWDGPDSDQFTDSLAGALKNNIYDSTESGPGILFYKGGVRLRLMDVDLRVPGTGFTKKSKLSIVETVIRMRNQPQT